MAAAEALGGVQAQWLWNVNASLDARRQYWANTLESGPGVRFRWKWMPASWMFSVSWLRGVYTVRKDNPYPRWYSDLRAGFWYAVTH